MSAVRMRGAAFAGATLLAAVLLLGRPVEGRITRLVIATTQSPTFAGTSFGAAGTYEKLVGQAFGEVDPDDPQNAGIADIALAPRNPGGMVEYAMDVFILKPVDMSLASGRLFYEVNNRGTKLAFNFLNTPNSLLVNNDPTSAADAGDGFLMRRGYVIAWSGWDVTVVPGGGRMTITVPVATNADSSPIVGPALEELIVDNAATTTGPLTYPAASLDPADASLTVRVHYSDVPLPIAASGWEYVDAKTIRLLPPGTNFAQGRLYDLVYPATAPVVAGLAFAATRDFVAFLRHATMDDLGTPNPVAGGLTLADGFGISQGARFLHDFIQLGFNQDEDGHAVFDGLLNYIAGPGGGFFNYRFAQPGRTIRQHRDRQYPEIQFPFAYQVLTDPVTGRTDGRLRRCLASGTCPKIFDVNSANEYWNKSASLLHVDATGRDLRDPPNVRFYLFSSLPHQLGFGAGLCEQTQNALLPNAGMRALLVALDDWVSAGKRPPPSRVPRVSRGTLVPSLPQDGVRFPVIPGVTYNGVVRSGDRFDFGATVDQGILATLPPAFLGSPYGAFVPRTDKDGNDAAGIRLPAVAAPVATYTGWAVRAPAFAGGDLCDASGQQIPFAATKAARLAAGDPRRSLEERYATHAVYVKRFSRAARRLRQRRLLLDEDVTALVDAVAAAPGPP